MFKESTNIKKHFAFLIASAFLLCAGTAHAATFFQYVSQPGDITGRGEQRTLAPPSDPFTAFGFTFPIYGGVIVRVGTEWELDFRVPSGVVPGTYVLPARFASQPNDPSLRVTRSGGSCPNTGRFTIHEFEFSGPNITKFAADFEAHCDGREAVLYGGVRYESNIPYFAPAQPPPAATRLAAADPPPPLVALYNVYNVLRGQVAPTLRAKALDDAGRPVANAHVTFTVDGGCGTFSGASGAEAVSDGAGIATAPVFTAVNASVRCAVWARLPAIMEALPFGITVYQLSDISLRASYPGAQIVTRTNQPFRVGVDVLWLGSPMLDYPVALRAPTSGAGVSGLPPNIRSDVFGNAVVEVTANAVSGDYRIVATAAGLEYSIAIVQRGAPASISAPSAITMRPSSLYAFEAQVRDASGLPIPGVSVMAFGDCFGASCASADTGFPSNTGADGRIHVTLFSRGPPGDFQIRLISETALAVVAVTLADDAPPPPATRSTRLTTPAGKSITLNVFTSESACTVSRASVIDPRAALFTPQGAPPPTLAFPQGLLDFRVDNCGVGMPVSFVIEFTDPLPPTATYWKYGPTPDNRAPHWYAMPGRIDGNRFTFTIVDGGVGDDDLIANGSITDLGGLAFNGGALQDLWWSGTAENGWGMSIIQHRDVLVANVYIYDDLGRPMWLIMSGGAWNAAHTAFTGPLYIPHSSPYYAYDVSRFNIGTPVGSATFTFSGENNAVFEYTINGVAGRKDITRLAFGRPDTLAAPGIGDLWWGGINQNGWGITVLQQLRTLFSLWFTYDAAGAPTWYVMPGGEWTASDTYEGRLYRAVGPKWIGAAYDPAQHRTIDVGSYRLRFTGENATFEYTIEGRSGTEPLTRLGF